jgi:hypothetical protein
MAQLLRDLGLLGLFTASDRLATQELWRLAFSWEVWPE